VSTALLREFDFAPGTRIVFGAGAVDRLGELALRHGARRVLLVTDPGIVRAGHAQRASDAITAAGLAVATFDRVAENPTTTVVERCVAAAREAGADFLVGLGGGSSMDTAKGCNFLLSGGGRMEDYWGAGKARGPMLPLIAVPTTAGTGSECQSYALISQAETHVKMACGDSKAAPRVALLDPRLTLSQPPRVAACSGIDALSHAVESAVTRAGNPLSAMFAREAFRLCAGGFPRVLAEPDDLEARGAMLLGAALAGLAIENSMLGAAHAAANPLTKRYGMAHGQAVGLVLPAVVRYNGEEPAAQPIYRQLLLHAGLATEKSAADRAAEELASALQEHYRLARRHGPLEAVAVPASDVESLAAEAAEQWTARFNPRSVTAEDFVSIYRSALDEHEAVSEP